MIDTVRALSYHVLVPATVNALNQAGNNRVPPDVAAKYLDVLSGLYNRRYLNDILLPQTIQAQQGYALAMIDIDRFKDINDTQGHVTGDRIIQEFSRFLSRNVRPGDTLVRYGGDEFLWFLPGLDRRSAETACWRIVRKLHRVQLAGMSVSVSIGVAALPEDGSRWQDLLEAADSGLYTAKRKGRDGVGRKGARQVQLPLHTLVDRKKDKEALLGFLQKKRSKMGIVLLKGAAGMGKTRLVKDTLSPLKQREVLWADCIGFNEEISYFAIREWLAYKFKRHGQAAAAILPPAYALEVSKLVPELAGRLGLEPQQILSKTLDKFRLYEGVKRVVDQGDRQKIMVIDNSQWLDKESIEVLRYMLRAFVDSNHCLLLVSRMDELPQPVAGFYRSISREADWLELEIAPLAEVDIGLYLHYMLDAPADSRLQSYICKRSGGNPLFIEELVSELQRTNRLFFRREQWHFTPPETPVVPAKVEELIQGRFERIGGDAQDLVKAAAVLGSFRSDWLSAITGLQPVRVIRLLKEVKENGFVRGDERLAFVDVLTRDMVLCRYMDKEERRLLHVQAERAMAGHPQARVYPLLGLRASHLFHAGSYEKALPLCIQAGEQARETYALDDSLRFFSRAVTILNKAEFADVRRLMHCLRRRASIYVMAGDANRAIKDLDAGINCAGAETHTLEVAKLLAHKATCLVQMFKLKDAQAAVEESLRLYTSMNHLAGMAESMNTMATIWGMLGKHKKALNLLKQSLKRFTQLQDKVNEARTLNSIAIIFDDQQKYEQAMIYYQKALEQARRAGGYETQAQYLNNLGYTYFNMSLYTEAMHSFNLAYQLAVKTGHRVFEASALNNMGVVYYLTCRYDKAIQVYHQVLPIDRHTGNRVGLSRAYTNLGNTCYAMGKLLEAEKFLIQAMDLRRQTDDIQGLALICLNLADVYLAIGRFADTQSLLKRAQALLVGIENPRYTLFIHLLRARLAALEGPASGRELEQADAAIQPATSPFLRFTARVELFDLYLRAGRRKEAQANLLKMEQIAQKRKVPTMNGHVRMARGRLAEQAGKAIHQLKQAAGIFEKTGSRFQQARCLYFLAQHMLREDREQAGRFREQALHLFQACGSALWQDKTRQLEGGSP